MADVQKSAFMLSSATIMMAPAFTTSVFELTPAAHSVGMVADVNINIDSSLNQLKNGASQSVVDSKKTGLASSITGNIYEMTSANFMRSQGFSGTPLQSHRGILIAIAGANGTSLTLISDPIPGEPASAITQISDLPAGSTLLVQRGLGQSDYIFPVKTTGAATTDGTSFTVPIQPIPAAMSFPIGSSVWVVQPIGVGNIDADDLFGVKIVGTLSNFNRPVTAIFPKVRMVKGFQLSFSATQYTSMNWEMSPILLSVGEATGRLADVGVRQVGLTYVAAGGPDAGSTPIVTPPNPSGNKADFSDPLNSMYIAAL